MCRCETVVQIRRGRVGIAVAFALLAVFAPEVRAQSGMGSLFQNPAGAELTASWKKVAGFTVSEGLSGPASGPVRSVWYAAGGSRLLVQTGAGRIFETSDFEHWRLNSSDPAPDRAVSSPLGLLRLPEPEARVQSAGTRLYAVGKSNIYGSDDNGRTWLNLTGFNNRSIVGGGFSGLAISPANPLEITASNQFGVWRSVDGGLSWRGLNDDLPNLTVRKILSRRTVALADSSVITLDSGSWTPVTGADPEILLRSKWSAQTGLKVTAAVQSGSLVYLGTADGKLLVSRDGAVRSDTPSAPGAAIERIWVDADRPDSALASAGNRLLRTINGGVFWDDVTSSLPSASIHGIAADRAAGVVYVATDRGIFSAVISLNDASAPGDWKAVSRDLPAAAAWDLHLNSDNTLTVALDGYGLYETPAPHRSRSVRLVNGADMSERPAAPGSLISILGANVRQGKSGALAYPVIVANDQTSQLQVPFEASSGVYQVTLQGASDKWTVPLTVRDASPALFVDSEGSPLLLDSASGLVLDPNVAVHAGALVQVLATGLGKVSPDWPSGVPAPLDSPPSVRGSIFAYLDGTPVQVTRATLAPGYVGYYIVELQIPSILNRGASELRILMNGEESNRVKLYLEPDRALQ